VSEYRAISPERAREMIRERGLRGWRVGRGKIPRIYKKFNLGDFMKAIKFVNSIGNVAEELGHHPDLCIESYNFVRVFLMTHDIKGLSTSDIELAERIEKIYEELKKGI